MSTHRIFNEFDLESRLMIATDALRKAAHATRDRRYGEASKQAAIVVRWLAKATPAMLRASPAYAAFTDAQLELRVEVQRLLEDERVRNAPAGAREL